MSTFDGHLTVGRDIYIYISLYHKRASAFRLSMHVENNRKTCCIWICKDYYLYTIQAIPDSKVHGAHMGPIWGRQDPCGPHVGPMNFAAWDITLWHTWINEHVAHASNAQYHHMIGKASQITDDSAVCLTNGLDNISKRCISGPLWRGSASNRWITLTNDQLCRERDLIMTLPWFYLCMHNYSLWHMLMYAYTSKIWTFNQSTLRHSKTTEKAPRGTYY